ncbi:MAG: carbohydrate ABC transporter permease [Spirochaetaceae bacterium]|nr:MAG: carbohydrate ABC transporter permease [Spirochaetaceae bacterium]
MSTQRNTGENSPSIPSLSGATLVQQMAPVLRKTTKLAIAVFFGVILIFPLIWLLSGALKPSGTLMRFPPTLIPERITLNNFRNVFSQGIPFQTYFMNSVLISALNVVGAVFLSAMMGYALAKYDFPGKSLLFSLILLGMLIPIQVLVVPMFLVVRDLGLINARSALVLPFIAHPLGAFLFRQYMLGVPSSVIESGRIEGAGEFRIFAQLFSPMVGPAFAAFSVVMFVHSWNSFVWPYVVLSDARKFVLPIWLNQLIQDPYVRDNAMIFAAALLTVVPAVILFIVFQRRFVAGFATTTEK